MDINKDPKTLFMTHHNSKCHQTFFLRDKQSSPDLIVKNQGFFLQKIIPNLLFFIGIAGKDNQDIILQRQPSSGRKYDICIAFSPGQRKYTQALREKEIVIQEGASRPTRAEKDRLASRNTRLSRTALSSSFCILACGLKTDWLMYLHWI